MTAVAALIAEVRPASVLTFGPDGGTGHPDHIAACRWTIHAFNRAALPGSTLLYSTMTRQWTERFLFRHRPGRHHDGGRPGTRIRRTRRTRRLVHLRRRDAHPQGRRPPFQVSQIEPMVQTTGLDLFRELVREEFFREPRPTDQAILDHNTHR